MREAVRKFHLQVMGTYNSDMYTTLLHEHELISECEKSIEFKDIDGNLFKDANGIPILMRGYFAKKDKTKYWIDTKFINNMPLRLGTKYEELKTKDDIVLQPLSLKPMKITPANIYDPKTFIDNYMPFEHSNPEHWFIAKIISIMGYVGRTYVCISSSSEFGKSSLFEGLHYLTDKSPVFKPRSVPGTLKHINGMGNIVFDETHRCKKEVRDIIEEFALQIAGGKDYYINGAIASHGMKSRYPCHNQSITFLYNLVDSYKNPREDYFEYIFSNNKAIDTRFIKVKLDGKLNERFDKDFDIPAEAASHRQYYINIAKQLLYLQELKRTNGYARRYVTNSQLNLKGRRAIIYAELTWLIDMYANDQIEYDKYINILDETIQAYHDMIKTLEVPTEHEFIREKKIEELKIFEEY